MTWFFFKNDEAAFHSLFKQMNSMHPNLRFTYDLSHEHITFLNLEIFKGPKFRATGKLDHSVHTKKVDTFQYLEASSSHAPSVFKGLIIGECQRYCRLSTSETDFIAKRDLFKRNSCYTVMMKLWWKLR